jgi:NTE family protein
MIKNTFILIFLLINTLNIQAQRPKIGLTLSGGGAKGLAHIGILQAIDSAGLKIDYITGTSMGSIIGAMYATGYSGNQIDSIAKLLDWSVLLSGKPKYTDVGIDEKDEFGKYSFEIPLDGLKAKMGTGLIESEEVWLQFSEIFFHVYDKRDFTKFNIPFKCIATDLTTGKPVVIDSGQIVKALRSSMAIPSVLSAVDYDSTKLVDGGIVRNFPVSDVKQMGADFIIGVNLFKGLAKAGELNSALDVMYQITNYRDADDLVKQKKMCNILIEPPVSQYSAGSFDSADDILEIGYKLREKYYPVFKKLADSLNKIQKIDYNPYSRLHQNKSVIIDNYEFIGLNKLSSKMIIQKSGLVLGNKYTSDQLNTAFRNMYSTLYFQYIYYELEPTIKGHANLKIILKEQYSGVFKIGLNYYSFVTPAIILNYTRRNLFFNKSRSMAKIAISQDMKGLLEHKQFFGKTLNNSFTLSLEYIQQRLPIYEKNNIIQQYKSGNFLSKAALYHYFGRNTALGTYFSFRRTDFSPDIASVFRFDGYTNYLVSGLDFEYNSLDKSFLPTNGVHAKINANLSYNRYYKAIYSGNDTTVLDTPIVKKVKDPLFRFDFFIDYFQKTTAKSTILSNVQGGFLLDPSYFYLENLFIGGSQKVYSSQFVFSGYYDGQIPATSFTSCMLGYQYNIWQQLYLVGKANIGVYNFILTNGELLGIDDIK